MKFMLRDLLWLFIVIGCICAIIAERQRKATEVQDLTSQLHAMTGQRNMWIEFAATAQFEVRMATGAKLIYLQGGEVAYDEKLTGTNVRQYDLEIFPIVP